jgi:cellulose synthase/poly-beta-1,6-N-acetylglucosamine synthase-like glycosyltransferase
MRALFLVSLALLFHVYVGWPLLCALAARLRRRAVADDPWWRPRVSVVVAARDEARVLEAKLESILAQRWPRARLEVIVVDDGSRDATAHVAARFAARGVRLLRLGAPVGKARALNAGVTAARGELLVLTDARQPLEPDAIAWLVAPLADPAVGAVSGELALAPGSGGLGLYRLLDDRVRRWEAARGSSVGVTGALWAARRALWTPLPPSLLLDDLAAPLAIARAGYRVVVAPGARVRDLASPDPARELRRRTRTLAGNLQLVRAMPWVLSPRANPLFFALLSHKLLRLLAPAALVGLLFANAALVLSGAPGGLYGPLLAAQIAVYAAAALAVPAPRGAARATRALAAFARVCRSFVLLHVAAVAAVATFARHGEARLWRDRLPGGAGEVHA